MSAFGPPGRATERWARPGAAVASRKAVKAKAAWQDVLFNPTHAAPRFERSRPASYLPPLPTMFLPDRSAHSKIFLSDAHQTFFLTAARFAAIISAGPSSVCATAW